MRQSINLADVYESELFDRSVDEGSPIKHKSVLCLPIISPANRTIGVIQVPRVTSSGRVMCADNGSVVNVGLVSCIQTLKHFFMCKGTLHASRKPAVWYFKV